MINVWPDKTMHVGKCTARPKITVFYWDTVARRKLKSSWKNKPNDVFIVNNTTTTAIAYHRFEHNNLTRFCLKIVATSMIIKTLGFRKLL